jgi:hypothetical protein
MKSVGRYEAEPWRYKVPPLLVEAIKRIHDQSISILLIRRMSEIGWEAVRTIRQD